jgi:hypothetical protein
MAGLVRHRQTKEPVTDRPRLNHLATSRLYSFDDAVSDSTRSDELLRKLVARAGLFGVRNWTKRPPMMHWS